MQNEMKAVFTLSKGTRLPPGLYLQLRKTFKCQICHSSPIKPPVIFTRCCKNILGCDVCVDRWYGGEDGRAKTSPLCRSERGFSEIGRLHGLDEFLETTKPLMDTDDNPVSCKNGDPQFQGHRVPILTENSVNMGTRVPIITV